MIKENPTHDDLLVALFTSQKKEKPHKLHTIYPNLEGTRMLFIGAEAAEEYVDEEGKIQKMQVFTRKDIFFESHKLDIPTLTLADYMRIKRIDILVVHPYISIIPEIDTVIEKNLHILILDNVPTVSKELDEAGVAWKREGIPTIKQTVVDEIPMDIMKAVAPILPQKDGQ
jgi:hypothetical protein